MTLEKYEEKKKKINVWYDEYINNDFCKLNNFGHLREYHLNKSDEFLRKRAVRLRKNCSTFCGDKELVIDLLKSTLIKNRDEIIEYLSDDDDQDIWEILESFPKDSKVHNKIYLFSQNHDWNNGPLSCEYFKISIKKLSTSNGFLITSAYPFY